YSKGEFSTGFSSQATGSGPYVVVHFTRGQSLRLKRNPHYWGKNLKVNSGRYNYSEIDIQVYREKAIWLEAFKAGKFDFAVFNDAKQWEQDTESEQWKSGLLI